MSAGGHGDQPTQRAVEGAEGVGVPVAEPASDEGDEEAGDSTDDSVDDHARNGLIEGEDRATVESDPAEPEDHRAEDRHRDVRRADLNRGAVRAEPTQTRTDDHDGGQSGPAAHRMNHGRAGEVDEPSLRQPAVAAPHPVAVGRVHDRHDEHDHDVGPELHPLRHCTGDDGDGRPSEHRLEQPEGGRARVERRDVLGEVGPAPPAADRIAEHQAIADNPEQRDGQTEIEDVLDRHVDVVLRPSETGLQKEEPGLHQENERCRKQHPQSAYVFHSNEVRIPAVDYESGRSETSYECARNERPRPAKRTLRRAQVLDAVGCHSRRVRPRIRPAEELRHPRCRSGGSGGRASSGSTSSHLPSASSSPAQE